MKQGRLIILFALGMLLCGCLGGIWSGASVVYDRHNVYKKVRDYQLFVETTNALFPDKKFKAEGCSIDVAVFHGDILVAGHLSSQALLREARHRLATVKGYKHLFDELNMDTIPANTSQDAWVTSKIRTQIFTDDSIDLKSFKVITVDGVVYLMGEVKWDEAEKVVQAARRTAGVRKVVKLMKYFTYQTKTEHS